MSNIVKINNNSIQIKEFKGQRVVTFKDIDLVHNRPEGTAGRNFRENRNRFIENMDYFEVNQPDEIRRLGIERPQGGTPTKVILITESGYLMLVKSFTDDLSWQVQRQLVNTYFRAKELMQPMSQIQILQQAINILAEQEKKLLSIEGTVSAIKDTIIQEPDNWREDMNRMFNKIVDRIGGQKFQEVRNESYRLLEKRARVDLTRRLMNLRTRMLDQGATKTAIEKANKLDVIEQDPKLREIYAQIIKEYYIRYVA
jgi:hypothetical protein